MDEDKFNITELKLVKDGTFVLRNEVREECRGFTTTAYSGSYEMKDKNNFRLNIEKMTINNDTSSFLYETDAMMNG